ncbi:hypothetical protein QBC39DRAFT_187317 [Podospora conica]|nr:hypothetical protein QBC39DRAFT_187317 [Schizothecium conicum]
MSSSLTGRTTSVRQSMPNFGPTNEDDSRTSYELSIGHGYPSRPALVICNPDPSPDDPDDTRAGATSTQAVPEILTDKTSGQYDRLDRRYTSFSAASDGGPTGHPSDSNDGGTRCQVDNTPWWQNQAPPDPPAPWYKRPIASLWKSDSLPSHMQPWWKRHKWLVALMAFLGTAVIIIIILWTTGTLKGTNMGNTESDDGDNGDSTSNTTSPNPSSTGTSPSATSTHPPASTGQSTKVTRCDDPSTYMDAVSWIGLDGLDGGRTAYEPKNSADDCCAACASSRGCAAWMYDPSSRFTPCVNLMTMADHKKPDDQCPKGYVDSVSSRGGGGRTAGTGPCGLMISMT